MESELPDKIKCLKTPPEVVTTRNLSYSFPGQDLLFSNLSLTFKREEITTILGETGVGKSTLINLIQLLYRPDEGEITYNHKIVNNHPFLWRKAIGVVPQEVKLFNARLWQNISLESVGTNDIITHRERVQKLVNEYHAFSFIEKMPQGLDTMLGEGGIVLSGGQKQLLGLARALINKPKFLILDEPTSSLDKKTEHLVLNLISELKKNIPILLVTHNIITASKTDYIYILDNHCVDIHGIPSDLRQFPNFFSNFFFEQKWV